MDENNVKWYVIHTYSGYENKVKANIEKVVENRELQKYIQDVQVPMEEQIEVKDGKKKVTYKKIFPGYVMVKMLMNEDSWYIVRNTRGVTGFVGPEPNKPVPLTEEEISSMGISEKIVEVDFEIGDSVQIVDGAFMGHIAQVREINMDKQTIKGFINMFNRETPVELKFNQIKNIE
ncbi:transcription antitermination protein nusG [Hathewaya proteolytica DSM 3090]|uniref:Transcription termination/antitermination protein NusG n=1 Tax=Hathewaya proteolytica DSM 3090 TaxID=1121331 RepID=A0A1M6T178_9CLOT|nr:transcription termination/antitermination protein NusG [Hathewaya proteolytica]SHK50677.1 transcription antitermination protein nusG [Hathewaya proteolytica DSM 3090]